MSILFRTSQVSARLFNVARPTYCYSLVSRTFATFPDDRKYTKDHEWVKLDGDVATVGITDHAQTALGDLVFIEQPEVGTKMGKGDAVVTVESVKATADVYAPVNGEVTDANTELADEPSLVNVDPHDRGWLVKLKVEDTSELDSLMSSVEYTEFEKSDS